jgi:L-ascorbate metabolism protein UlaG (beta-lactamase superfamily)
MIGGKFSLLGGRNIVKRILVSAQWDVWGFQQFGERPLVTQRVLVISHGHIDHIDGHPEKFDTVLYPTGLPMPERLRNLRNVLIVERSEKIERLVFTQVGPRELSTLLNRKVESLHARWWLVRTVKEGEGVLFVGDLDFQETSLVAEFAKVARNHGVRCVLLPSYGGLMEHGSVTPLSLKKAIENLAYTLRNQGFALGGLPHPITPDWADFAAIRT